MIKIGFNDLDIEKLLKSPKPSNGETINIFWSGGVDSTYMMLWLLCHGYYVNAYWVEIECNQSKNEKEKEARKKIVATIEKQYPELYSRLSYFSTPAMSVKSRGHSRTYISQAPIWLLATQLIGTSNHFAMGYVSGDDALTWIDAIKGVIANYNKMTSPHDKVEMHFPLMKIKKKWFFEYIPWDIRKDLYWCEYGNSDHKVCKCVACTTHRHLLDSLGIQDLVVS